MFAILRRLRHGPLRWMNPIWLILGRLYRRMAARSGSAWGVCHRIGPYGPFKLDRHFAFSDFEHWGGGHNNGFGACVERCRGLSCVFDIGAHIGLVALPVASVLGADGRVFAFEPATSNLGYLRQHLHLNKVTNVEVIDSLVGAAESAEVTFYESPDATGANSVLANPEQPGFIETRRHQVSIDGFCAARGLAPQVIKIDVEGAEFDVLSGAADTLRSCGPDVFLSVHPVHLTRLGHDCDELCALIDTLGYEIREIDGSPPEVLRLREYLLSPTGAI